MATQTGSIDLTATNAVKLYAEAGFTNIGENYYSKADFDVAPNEIIARVGEVRSSLGTVANPNLTPYFSMPMTMTTDDYWSNISYAKFTQQADGWAHFEYNNTGSVTSNNYICPKNIDTLTPGGVYTLLIEFRNVSISANGGRFYSQQQTYGQIWGADGSGGFSISTTDIRALNNGAGVFYKKLTLLDADSKDLNGTVRGSLPKTQFMSINQQVQAGQSVSYDLRLSLYEGEYGGPYKPYVGEVLFASQGELKVQSDRIGMVVSNSDASSSLQLTAEAMQYIGGHVEITDEAGTSTVISGGKVVADNLRVKAANIDGTLAIGQVPEGAKNSNVMMVSWNLLRRSENFVASDIALTRSTVPESGLLKLTPTGSASYAKFRINYLDYAEHGYNTYSFSCDARLADDSTEYTTTNLIVYIGYSDSTAIGSTFANNEHHRYTPAQYLAQNGELTTSWQRLSVTVTLPDAATGGTLTPTAGSQLCVQLAVSGSRKPVLLRYPKLELGGHATDWTPSPSDASNSALVVGGRNLLLDTSDSWSEWVTPTPNATNQSSLFWKTADTSMLTVGSKLTFSCEVEFSGVTASSSGTFRARSQGAAYGDGGSITTVWGVGPCAETFDLSTPPADGVYRYEKTVTLTTDYSDRVSYRCYPRMDYWASGSWRMRRCKLEVGEKATDWTPAPEDQTAYVDDLATQVSQAAEADAEYKRNLEETISQLLEETKAANDRTQSLRFDTTDGLTIGSKALDQIETDFNINIKGEGMKFRYKQQVLATASGSGFDAPHLIAGTDLTIGTHWRWQELDGRLVLVYV